MAGMTQNTRAKIAARIRLFARVVSGGILTLFFAFLIGEAAGKGLPAALSVREGVMFVCLFVMLAGLITGFWKPLAACAMLVAGSVGFFICDQSLNLGSPFALFGVVAVLYAAAWAIEHRRRSK